MKETNSAGTVTLTRKNHAFGNLQLGTNSGYAFTGREWDGELYYYRARYYDPKIGRFISEDPGGDEDGPNRYAYVGNRPTVLRDPSGTHKIEDPVTGEYVYHSWCDFGHGHPLGEYVCKWEGTKVVRFTTVLLVVAFDPAVVVAPVVANNCSRVVAWAVCRFVCSKDE